MSTLIVHLPSLCYWESLISIRFLILLALPVWGLGHSPWHPSALQGQERPEPEPRVAVQGQVVEHETGDPIWSAAVSLGSGPSGTRGQGTRVTGEDGRFLFRNVTPGTYRLSVTIQGYRTMNDTLQVSGEEDLDLILPLSIDPIRLEPIIVTAEREPLYRRGFEARRRNRSGFLVTREEIEERNPRLLSELLNRVPGGIVLSTPPFGYTLYLRGQCRPGIWVDGMKVPFVDSIDQLVSPRNVEAVEVYHGFDLPVEFGVNSCGGVLIWTRSGTPAPPGSGSGSDLGLILKLGALAGAMLLAFLVVG